MVTCKSCQLLYEQALKLLQVWNNVGLCFFAKQRYIAAIACLKHALYLSPFEWIVSYNLGLVHINTQQYASAFNYLSAAINLKPNFSHSYMYLGVTLARLGDLENAGHAYERAIEKDPGDMLFRLNFGVPSLARSASVQPYLLGTFHFCCYVVGAKILFLHLFDDSYCNVTARVPTACNNFATDGPPVEVLLLVICIQLHCGQAQKWAFFPLMIKAVPKDIFW
jgi:tetratricopeptide (TPR) repeat protein